MAKKSTNSKAKEGKAQKPIQHSEKTEEIYEVLLSFAGENRDYVEKVAEFLKQNNVNVFYDSFEETELWGKDLVVYFSELYGKKGRFCIPFISKFYAEKAFPILEFRNALVKAMNQKEEYILPARFDETEIPGLRSSIAYIDLREKTPEEFGLMILKKLGKKPKKLENSEKTLTLKPDYSTILITKLKSKLKKLGTNGKDLEEVATLFSELLNNVPSKDSVETVENIIDNETYSIGKNSKIEAFILQFNLLLESDFAMVKERFFSAGEKVGIILWQDPKMTLERISYSLFSVPFGQEKTLIKEIDGKKWEEFARSRIVSSVISTGRSFFDSPKVASINIITEYLTGLFQQLSLKNAGNLYLAQEYIFSTIDFLHFPQELSFRDSFFTSEIQNLYLDFVKKIFGEEEKTIGAIGISGDSYRFFGFHEILKYLGEEKIAKISRNFKKPDFVKLYQRDPASTMELYSPKGIEKDIRNFYKNLPAAYQCIFKNNFPALISSVPHFHNATKLLVYVKYGEGTRSPYSIKADLTELYLRNEEEIGLDIEIFFNIDAPELSKEDWKGWEHEGKKYRVLLVKFGRGDEVYADLGMLKKIYQMIWQNISDFYGFKKFPIMPPSYF